jgi:hypothetical protein
MLSARYELPTEWQIPDIIDWCYINLWRISRNWYGKWCADISMEELRKQPKGPLVALAHLRPGITLTRSKSRPSNQSWRSVIAKIANQMTAWNKLVNHTSWTLEVNNYSTSNNVFHFHKVLKFLAAFTVVCHCNLSCGACLYVVA